MSATPLTVALATWAQRDEVGGFQAVAERLFPGWEAKRSCKAPHREEKTPSFGVYQNESGAWRFKDFGDGGEQGGLVGFVMLAGFCDADASRWLMEGAGVASGGPALPAYTPRPAATPKPRMPYAMSAEELAECVAMAEDLLRDEKAIRDIADSRGWKPETIRGLAMGPCLGLKGRKFVCIYPGGAKLRLKPLTPAAAESFNGVPFRWLFGKPHELWRADHVLPITETIHLTEGETAAITLVDAGIDNGGSEIVLAVAGAKIWRDEWKPLFAGRSVVIWPDADGPGEELKERVIASVGRAPRSIKVASTKGARQ